jgi:hypothetical protein
VAGACLALPARHPGRWMGLAILQSHTEVCSLGGLLSIRPLLTAAHFEDRYTNLVLSPRLFPIQVNQQVSFQGENPAYYTAINAHASEPPKARACTLDEIRRILGLLSDPSIIAFAAAPVKLRRGFFDLCWEPTWEGKREGIGVVCE